MAMIITLNDEKCAEFAKLLTDWSIDSYYRGTESEQLDAAKAYEFTREQLQELFDAFGVTFYERHDPRITVGEQYYLKVTTDTFLAKVVRELDDSEKDPEVGPMYEVTIQVFGDELTPLSEFCRECGQPDNCGDCNHKPGKAI